MNRRTKIITGVSVAVLSAVVFLLVNGFHAMNIEDHYGDLQTVYYRAEDGDVIIDNQNSYGFLKKRANRIYVEEDDCLRDLNSWVHRSEPPVKFSVYRLAVDETWITAPSYPQMQRLIREQKLQPIVRN
jgi:MFS superfamily sulfate permease-like transporter